MDRMMTPFAHFATPYTTKNKRTDVYLHDPEEHITVIDLLHFQDAGVRKVKLTFRQELPKLKPFQGYFVFAPRSGWVVLEYRDESPLGLYDTVQYGAPIHGIPVAKKVVHRNRKYGSEPMCTSEVIGVRPGPAPAELFSPEAFGLPDLTKPPRKNWVLLPLGLVGLVAAALLALFIRRRRSAVA